MADKKTRSEAALLVLVVFLLGAIAGGTANHLWGERVWGKQPAVGQSSRDQIVSRMTNDLNLTPDQAQQFGAIVDDTRSKIRDDYAAADSQRDNLRAHGRDRIRAILNADQIPKFDALMKKLDEDRKKDQQAQPQTH
jgi:Spy/CpxP family protein refolding chaperone